MGCLPSDVVVDTWMPFSRTTVSSAWPAQARERRLFRPHNRTTRLIRVGGTSKEGRMWWGTVAGGYRGSGLTATSEQRSHRTSGLLPMHLVLEGVKQRSVSNLEQVCGS